MDYFIYLSTLIGIYIIASLAYSIPVGYAGLVNFGQAGLLAIGAYTAAILSGQGVAFPLALLTALCVTAVVGFFLGLPARRIKNDYYALITLGFLFVVNAVILNWTSLTGGPFGISGIRRPPGFESPEAFLYLVCIILILVAFFVYRIVRSPFGSALEAVRDDDLVAESLGKPVGKLKIVAMTLSGALTGVAGALFAYFIQFINHQLFWLDLLVFSISIIVTGGLASFRGTILGVILLFLLYEPLRFLAIPSEYLGPLRIIINSGLLLAFILFRPKGIMGRAQLDQ